MPLNRLAPGVALVSVPGRGLAVRTPEGSFLRVETDGVDEPRLLGRLASGIGEEDAQLAALVAAFEEAGYLAGEPERPLAGATVLLTGDEELIAPVERCAVAEGAQVRHVEASDVAAVSASDQSVPRTAVVWCLNRPVSPGLWDHADQLPAHGIGWLRCHREGRQVWLEPPASRAGDVTSADVRLRRLAAHPAHQELAAYWAGDRTPENGPTVTEASAALIASLLTADLVAWATGSTPSSGLPVHRLLRRLDLSDLTVSEHPVQPVPPVAPLGVARLETEC